jgi:hypothetical protein
MLHGVVIVKISKRIMIKLVKFSSIIHLDISLLKLMDINTLKLLEDMKHLVSHIFFSLKEENMLSTQKREDQRQLLIMLRNTDQKMFKDLIVDRLSSKKEDRVKWLFTGDLQKLIQDS